VGFLVVVSNLGADRATIRYPKTSQNTARIARIAVNVAICRSFVRSILPWVIDRSDGFIAHRRKYRPRINRQLMCVLQVFLFP
jgi:hypothetical protein